MKSINSSYNIPERFLKQLWKNKQFATLNLKTTDGKPIEILSVGKSNLDGGPDFVDAVIRIDGVIFRGDVELHQINSAWFDHKHHSDRKYNSVILHVIFDGKSVNDPPVTQSKRRIPILALDKYIVSTFHRAWESMILDERAERSTSLKCSEQNDRIDSQMIQLWLDKLSIERIELKVRRFENRLKDLIEEERLSLKEPVRRYGESPVGLNPEELPPPEIKYSTADYRKINFWEQLLYEGIMEGLGFSKNQKPFIKLARNVRLKYLTDVIGECLPEERIPVIEAILFGVSGLLLLPKRTMDNESKKYLRSLRSHWKNLRITYSQAYLQENEWQFFRLRPKNFPTIRIAGAAKFIADNIRHSTLKSIIQLIKSNECQGKEKQKILEDKLTISAEGYWSSHYRFGEVSGHKIKTLIGKNRANEIILNAIIPICLLYARLFKSKEVRDGAMSVLDNMPKLTENTITKTIDEQLIKTRIKFSTAKLQQGAIQLYKFYCMEGKCNECAIGKNIFS